MTNKNFFLSLLTLGLWLGIGAINSFAQWGAPYSNNWIYSENPYIKINVTKSGIHKIPFTSIPSSFPLNKPENLKIFHLGKEISIISTDNNEIIFYAVPNDGSSDSLLYRPMSSRINPYSSIYSTTGAYFLTVDNTLGKRAQKEAKVIDQTLSPLSFHLESDVKVNSQEYSHSTQIYIKPDFINSFFEDGASKTGERLLSNTLYTYPYLLKNRNHESVIKPSVKILLHGRSNNSRDVELYVGKDAQNLRKITTKNIVNFIAQIVTIELENSDISDSGNFFLAFKSTSDLAVDRFSIGFIETNHPQNFLIDEADTNKIFTLPASPGVVSRIKISSTSKNKTIYDISDVNNPRIILGDISDFVVARKINTIEKLLVTNQYSLISAEQISLVSFQNIKPAFYNYIIVTNETLESSAQKYAAYRSSTEGGAYRPIVIKIKDVYNQFNFGEVSPVAIRRFADYMISDGNTEKYLVLLGKSTTFVERMSPELLEDVPAIGYPASDILLVEGLAGTPTNQPAIPVGRISAVNTQQLDNYLQKVKDYEQNAANDYGWRKKVLHMNGGKTAEELSQFRTTLSDLASVIENGFVGGSVTGVSKQSIIEVERANITPEINEGVGLVTFLGHGNQYVTDFDLGFVSEAGRGYQNANKYPVMYFNGCSVGNIFNAHLNPDLSASDKMPLSMDWLFASKKGAIAIIANSFEGYVSPLVKYLNGFYSDLFTKSQSVGMSIGKVQTEAIKGVLGGVTNYFDIANIHQALLQGDPAIHVISVEYPDYQVDPVTAITLYSESGTKNIEDSKTIRTAVTLSNFGRYIKGEQVPIQIIYSFANSADKVVTEIVSATPNQDTIYASYENQNQALTAVKVKIDPNNILSEMDKNNNISELVVDWNVAKKQFIYTLGNTKDLISPVLNVNFNGRVIKNGATLAPNPIINFIVQDDRLIQGDTTLLDIYLKSCDSDTCDFKRITYSSNQFVLNTLSGNTFNLKLSSRIKMEGTYELLVTARDEIGNSSLQSYRVKFNILEETSGITVVVSPNPASEYVHFEVASKVTELKSIKYLIYNLKGVLVASKDIVPNESAVNEWYWLPNVDSGLYLYKVILNNNGGTLEEKSGKIVLTR